MQKRKTLGELGGLAPLLGKSRGDARQWLKTNNIASPNQSWVRLEVLCVVSEDGVRNGSTLSICLERVNVELENGVVSKIVSLG